MKDSNKKAREAMERPSTHQGWVMEPSGPVKDVPIEQFLAENPGYESGYTRAFNYCKTKGCTVSKGVWKDKKGRSYDNVFECYGSIS